MDHWWRVTRYDPAMRDSRGAYKADTWTSISDIGREIDGHKLTFDEYSAAEDSYVAAFMRFAEAGGVKRVEVRGFEHGEGLNEGLILDVDGAADVLRRILREDAWCRLEALDESFAVHAGHDYYMFIGSNTPSTVAVEDTRDSGLFVEPDLVSPYIPQDD